MFDMRKRRQLALTAVAAMLAACTTLSRLEPPEVVALTVRNVEIRLPTIRVDTELTLRNPNAVAVSVASLDADLEIGGERAGTLRLASPVTLPAAGTATLELSAVGDAAVALSGLGRALGSGGRSDTRSPARSRSRTAALSRSCVAGRCRPPSVHDHARVHQDARPRQRLRRGRRHARAVRVEPRPDPRARRPAPRRRLRPGAGGRESHAATPISATGSSTRTVARSSSAATARAASSSSCAIAA
jgi:LEA14-like dessication related protein